MPKDGIVAHPAFEPLALEAVEIASWLLAFIELCAAAAAVAFGRRWKAAWLLALGAGGILQFVLYSNAPAWMILFWRNRRARSVISPALNRSQEPV